MKYLSWSILAPLSLFALNNPVVVLADGTFQAFQEFQQAEVNTFGEATIQTQSLSSLSTSGEVTDKFESSVKTASGKSSAINQGIGVFKESIDDTQNALNAPRKVKNNAVELYNALDALEQVLKTIGFIPYAKPVTKVVNQGVKRLKPLAKKAKDTANRVHRKVDPFLRKTYKVEDKVNKLRSNISKVIYTENSLLDKVKQSEKMFPQLDSARDALTGGFITPVNQFNDMQDSTLTVINTGKKQTESLRKILSSLSDLADAIDDVTDVLGPIKAPLLEIKKALDFEVCLFFCVSISDVLNNPVLKAFNFLVEAILNPIIGGITIPGFPTSIPGMDVLDRVEQQFAEIERAMDNGINFFTDAALEVLEYSTKFEGFEREIANLRP